MHPSTPTITRGLFEASIATDESVDEDRDEEEEEDDDGALDSAARRAFLRFDDNAPPPPPPFAAWLVARESAAVRAWLRVCRRSQIFCSAFSRMAQVLISVRCGTAPLLSLPSSPDAMRFASRLSFGSGGRSVHPSASRIDRTISESLTFI